MREPLRRLQRSRKVERGNALPCEARRSDCGGPFFDWRTFASLTTTPFWDGPGTSMSGDRWGMGLPSSLTPVWSPNHAGVSSDAPHTIVGGELDGRTVPDVVLETLSQG